jgi:hypothetical protein
LDQRVGECHRDRGFSRVRGEAYNQNLDVIALEVAQKRASESQMLPSF